MAFRSLVVCVLALVLFSSPTTASRRGLAQFYPETFTHEEVNEAASAARNATATARSLLVLSGVGEVELTVFDAANQFIVGHYAADAAGVAAEIGQISALSAAAEASAATAIATVAAVNKSESLVAEAQSVIEQAELFTSQIRDEDNSTVTPATSASLRLFSRLVHDGSLILYWANETNGAPQDGETYNETVYFIAGIDEESNQTISEFLQTELTAGANPAVGLSLVHVILHQLLGAIDVYRGDFAAAAQQQVDVSNAVRKAAAIVRSGTTFDAAQLQEIVNNTQTILTQAVTSGDAAASGAPTASVDIDALQTAVTELDGRVEAAEGGIQTPAPAPSGTTTSSAGR